MRQRTTALPSRSDPTARPPLPERLPRFVRAIARTPRVRLLVALAALSLVGWLNMPTNSGMSLMASLCGARGVEVSAARMRALFDQQWAAAGQQIADGGWMLLAMSPPLLLGPIGSLWTNTPQRRPAHLTAFVLGYGGIWLLVLPLLSVLMLCLAIAAEWLQVAAWLLGAGVALAWQFGACKRAAVARCRRPASGRDARRPTLALSLGFGVTQAIACVGTCWAAMTLPMLVSGDPRPLAALVACLLFIERVVSSPATHGAR